MKKPLLLGIAGVIVLLGVLLSCKEIGGGGISQRGIRIGHDDISVRPVTALQPADRTELENILGHAKKALFEVSFYRDGKVRRQLGTLACITQAVINETNKDAQARNLSDCAFQIGAERVQSTGSPVVACRIAAADGPQADALLARVRPILEKYASR